GGIAFAQGRAGGELGIDRPRERQLRNRRQLRELIEQNISADTVGEARQAASADAAQRRFEVLRGALCVGLDQDRVALRVDELLLAVKVGGGLVSGAELLELFGE